jgi:NAD(P)-dependent dehydrogenase (short-subunit alcohol dehydrogenase family)
MREFQDKVAVITGAGRGIGRGIAIRCAREGMKVVLAGIGEESLRLAEGDLKAQGAAVRSVQTDVSQVADVERLAEETLRAFGSVDLLVNNAGVIVKKNTTEHTLADWRWVIDVNLWGVIHGVHVFLPIMRKQATPCHIVNLASTGGLTTGGSDPSYYATKHAVVALSESLHKEMRQASTQVSVSVFCPGYVKSDLAGGDRNRPANLRNMPADGAYEAELKSRYEAFGARVATGMTPEEAADHLFGALKQDRFYVLSHPTAKDNVQKRMEDILDERDPLP